MKSLLRISAQAPLRLGLALTYLYSSMGLIRRSEEWAWYVPGWFEDIVTRFTTVETFLRIQGAGELLLALLLLAWFLKPKVVMWVAILGALHVAAILASTGVDAVTFRDIGLLGAWITLAFLTCRGAPQTS